MRVTKEFVIMDTSSSYLLHMRDYHPEEDALLFFSFKSLMHSKTSNF